MRSVAWEARAQEGSTIGIYVGDFLAGTVKQTTAGSWHALARDYFGDLRALPANFSTAEDAGGAVYNEYLDIEKLDDYGALTGNSMDTVIMALGILLILGAPITILWRMLT